MNTVEPIRSKRKIGAIKRMLKGSSLRDYALFTFGVNSALRVGDLLALTLGDVLDEEGNLRSEFKLRMRKTGKEVRVTLSDSARDALSEYLNTRDMSDFDAPLFPGRDGERPLHRSTVHRIVQRAARDVGLEGAHSSHSLRKSWGYHAYQQGHDIQVISEALGHSDASVTRRYIGLNADDVRKAQVSVNL